MEWRSCEAPVIAVAPAKGRFTEAPLQCFTWTACIAKLNLFHGFLRADHLFG